jgi:hypothetical protein
MKPLLPWIFASLLVTFVHAELAITTFESDGWLTWTNSTSDALYRIEAAPSHGGPWSTFSTFSSIQASNHQVAIQLPPPGPEPLQFFRVLWTDALPAEPEGIWEYSGFDPDGGLSVTGLVSIATSDPMSGTVIFQAVGADPHPRHPVGSSAILDGTVSGSNEVMIPLPAAFLRDNFRLDGQMNSDEYWGWWSYTDSWIDLSGRSGSVTIKGRFSARRRG